MIILLSARRTSAVTLLNSPYHSSATVLDPSFSIIQVLQLSIDHQYLKLSKQSHARVCRLGLQQNAIVATKLISAYSICGNADEARVVFDSFRYKNVYIWNAMVNGYAKTYLHGESFALFNQMCRSEDSPDNFTLSTLSKVSGEVGDLNAGEAVHGKCIRTGYVSDVIVANSITSMYCKCGKLIEARNMFAEMPHRSVSSWNVLISGFLTDSGYDFDSSAWKLIKCMQIDGLKPDAFTVSSLLPLCGGDHEKWNYGRELHCYIVKNGLDLVSGSDAHLGCCLIDMYSRSNKVNLARQIFYRMKYRNIFAWTALINGFVQDGALDEALVLFRDMQVRDGIEPNRVSLVSVLPACGSLASLMSGKEIHGFSIRKKFNYEVSFCNALVDMYSKCGSLNCARRVFEDDSFCKDTISWSSMIFGYGLHGRGQEAISLYKRMVQLGIKPDTVTVVGVLSACGRSGLVNEGLKIYNSAINDYRILPTLEICACMVDMLGRTGQLKQALDFIKTMPMEPGPSVWGALLNAAILHCNSEMLDLAYKCLIKIEPDNPSNYISLSNLYASSEKWNLVAELRLMMKERQLRKLPGCSWISINDETHSFFVTDKVHPHSDMIYQVLDELILAMKEHSNFPDFEHFL
ncbi:hypothetical protein NMG60_11017566 [Bertholletia excelsa]